MGLKSVHSTMVPLPTGSRQAALVGSAVPSSHPTARSHGGAGRGVPSLLGMLLAGGLSSLWAVGLGNSAVGKLLSGGFPQFVPIWPSPRGSSQIGSWTLPEWASERGRARQQPQSVCSLLLEMIASLPLLSSLGLETPEKQLIHNFYPIVAYGRWVSTVLTS